MKPKHHPMLALALSSALLAAMPAAASAAPSDLIFSALAVGDTMPAFTGAHGCLGVRASAEPLYQAFVGGRSINLRLYDEKGERALFIEDLQRLDSQTGDMRLAMRLKRTEDAATLELDQDAIDTLTHFGVVELAVADANSTVLAVYALDDLQTLRDGLALSSGELLCVSGEDSPVTVVSEEGVRRRVE